MRRLILIFGRHQKRQYLKCNCSLEEIKDRDNVQSD